MPRASRGAREDASRVTARARVCVLRAHDVRSRRVTVQSLLQKERASRARRETLERGQGGKRGDLAQAIGPGDGHGVVSDDAHF